MLVDVGILAWQTNADDPCTACTQRNPKKFLQNPQDHQVGLTTAAKYICRLNLFASD